MILNQNIEFIGHKGPITQLKFNKDNNFLISSSQDTTIRLWSILNLKEITSFKGHMGSVNSFDTDELNRILVSGSSDNSIVWWDVKNQIPIRRIKGHDGGINSIKINHNSNLTISGSLDSKVKIWDNRSNNHYPIQILDHSKDSITSIELGNHEIFTASLDGKLRTYDIRSCKMTIDSLDSKPVHIELSLDGQYLLISTLDSKILLFSKNNGVIDQTYFGHKCNQCYIKCKFAANHGVVISGSETGEVFIWELVEGILKYKFPYESGPISDISSSNPFDKLAVGSEKGNIGIFVKNN